MRITGFNIAVTSILIAMGTPGVRSQDTLETIPYRIVTEGVRLVDSTVTVIGKTKGKRPKAIRKRTGSKYEFTVSVALRDTGSPMHEPFAIVCRLPDEKMQSIVLNNDLGPVESVVPAVFRFRLECDTQGEATLRLGTYDPEKKRVKATRSNNRDFVRSVRLR